jgi:hypothetical protein
MENEMKPGELYTLRVDEAGELHVIDGKGNDVTVTSGGFDVSGSIVAWRDGGSTKVGHIGGDYCSELPASFKTPIKESE